MTVLDRLKSFLDSTGLSKSEIARTLDVTPQYIWKLYNSDAEPSERIILSVLKSFPKLSEEWLRTGSGEMFAPKSREEEIAQIAANMFHDDDNSFRFQLIKTISSMTEQELETLKNSMDYMIEFMSRFRK